MSLKPTRRGVILGAAALATVPTLAGAAAGMVEYRPGLARDLLASGQTVLLDFSAVWCSTCRAQGRAIQALRDENPAFDEAITFVRVDWDQYGRSELAQSLSVPRRSTLILLRGETELGRIVANPSASAIEDLLERAL